MQHRLVLLFLFGLHHLSQLHHGRHGHLTSMLVGVCCHESSSPGSKLPCHVASPHALDVHHGSSTDGSLDKRDLKAEHFRNLPRMTHGLLVLLDGLLGGAELLELHMHQLNLRRIGLSPPHQRTELWRTAFALAHSRGDSHGSMMQLAKMRNVYPRKAAPPHFLHPYHRLKLASSARLFIFEAHLHRVRDVFRTQGFWPTLVWSQHPSLAPCALTFLAFLAFAFLAFAFLVLGWLLSVVLVELEDVGDVLQRSGGKFDDHRIFAAQQLADLLVGSFLDQLLRELDVHAHVLGESGRVHLGHPLVRVEVRHDLLHSRQLAHNLLCAPRLRVNGIGREVAKDHECALHILLTLVAEELEQQLDGTGLAQVLAHHLGLPVVHALHELCQLPRGD